MSASNLPPDHPPHMRWRTVGSNSADNNPAPVIIQDASTGIHIPTHDVVPLPGSPVNLDFGDLTLRESMRSVRIPAASYTNPPVPSNEIYFGAADHIVQTGALPGRPNRMYGFEAEDLVNGNAVHCSPCRPSSLEGPNLKIFHPNNFIDTPDDTYRALVPALALAEKLMLYGSTAFFVTLVSGRRIIDEHLSNQRSQLMYRLHPPSTNISSFFNPLVSFLQTMGDHIQWRFEYKGNVFGQYHGQNFVPRRELVPAWNSENPSTRMISITLHKNFYEIARTYAVTRWPNEAQKLRYHYFLAVVICHELAHAIDAVASDTWWLGYCDTLRQVYGLNASSRLPQRISESILGNDDTDTEIGAHFEIKTFGGRIAPIGNLMHAKYGVLLHNGAFLSGNHPSWWPNVQAQRPNVTVIPMSFMEELQQESFWSRQDIDKSLIVPVTGLTALSGRHTTTVSWRDHLLDMEEERRDAMQRNPRSLIPLKRRSSRTPSPYMRKRIATNTSFGVNPSLRDGDPNRSRMSIIMGTVRRRAQMPIRRFASKAALDEAGMRGEMIQSALREQWQTSLERGREHAEAEARRAYVAPESSQTDIHAYFQYDGEADESSSQNSDDAHDYHAPAYDALRIPSHRLRIEDKWILLEELTVLSMGWDTSFFLAKRHRQELGFIPPRYAPESSDSWSDNERRVLYGLRLIKPGHSWPEQRDARRRQQANLRNTWRTYNEMEELATLRGYSRIKFNSDAAANRPLPLGMTVSNFDEFFRPLLHAERELKRLENSDQATNFILGGEGPSDTYDPDSIRQWLANLDPNKITNYTLPLTEIEKQRDLARLQEQQRLRLLEAVRLAHNKSLFNWLPWQDHRPGDYQDASGAIRSAQRLAMRTSSLEKRRNDRHKKARSSEDIDLDDGDCEEIVVGSRRKSL